MHELVVSSQELENLAMSLSLPDRAELAQALWESLEMGTEVANDADALKRAIRRDAELSEGAVAGRSHEDVMQAARRAIRCA